MPPVSLSKGARKFIDTLAPKQAAQIAKKIFDLCFDPFPADSIDLKGQMKGYRRTDIGEFRIIYRVGEGVVHVHDVGKRNDADIYRRARRK
jgi:mRNA interferase RelE/StbE